MGYHPFQTEIIVDEGTTRQLHRQWRYQCRRSIKIGFTGRKILYNGMASTCKESLFHVNRLKHHNPRSRIFNTINYSHHRFPLKTTLLDSLLRLPSLFSFHSKCDFKIRSPFLDKFRTNHLKLEFSVKSTFHVNPPRRHNNPRHRDFYHHQNPNITTPRSP